MKRHLILLLVIFLVTGCKSDKKVCFIFPGEVQIAQRGHVYVDGFQSDAIWKVTENADAHYVVVSFPEELIITKNASIEIKNGRMGFQELHVFNTGFGEPLNDGDSMKAVPPTGSKTHSAFQSDSVMRKFFAKDSAIKAKALEFMKVYMDRKKQGLN